MGVITSKIPLPQWYKHFAEPFGGSCCSTIWFYIWLWHTILVEQAGISQGYDNEAP